jgi:hypothetical protein
MHDYKILRSSARHFLAKRLHRRCFEVRPGLHCHTAQHCPGAEPANPQPYIGSSANSKSMIDARLALSNPKEVDYRYRRLRAGKNL